MNRTGEAVLAEAAELALAAGTRMVEPKDLIAACSERGIDNPACFAALGALKAEGLVQFASADPAKIVLVSMNDTGVLRHLDSARPDMPAVRDRIAAAVAAAAGQGPVALAEQVGEPPLLVECVLDQWIRERRIVYSKAPGRRFRIHKFRE